MPSPQQTGKQRLLALAAGRVPRTQKPAQDLRAHGGKVQGPGTPTSDSIDAKLSSNEFVLPADTTRKVGLRRLNQLVAATHKPTGKEKKPGHYADGGLVEDEEQARQDAAPSPARVQPPSPTAMFVDDSAQEAGQRWDQGDVAGAIGAGARTAVGGVGMAAIEALDNTVGAAGRGLWEGAKQFADGFTGSSAQAADPESPATASAVPSNAIGTTAASASPESTEVVDPASLNDDAPAKAIAPASNQVSPGIYSHGKGQFSDRPSGMGFSDGFTGQPNAQDLQRAADIEQKQNPVATYLQSTIGEPVGEVNQTSTKSPIGMSPQQAQQEGLIGERIGYDPAYDQRLNASSQGGGVSGAAQSAGNSNKVRESWGDFANRMMALERGQPVDTGGGQVPQMRTPTVSHSLNDFAVRKRLENLKTGASSIMNTPRWGGRNAHLNPSVTAYEDAVKADTKAILEGQPGLSAKAMEVNAGLQREGMQQRGANSRTGVQEAGANRREGLRSLADMAKFDREAPEQRLRVRGMQRLDQVQEELVNAQSLAQASSARARLLALLGKSGQEQTRWRSGNDQNGAPFLYNEATSETRPVRAPAAKQAPAEESRHRGSDGRQYVMRNGQYVPVESR